VSAGIVALVDFAATPADAWAALERGNARFVAGEPTATVDPERRRALARSQSPFAMIFGCSDSRVAAELVFDRGLGELFVIRTAGHVVDSGVLASVEYGVSVLKVPLVVVMGHDSCGAVSATVETLDGGTLPMGYLRDLVERLTPSVLSARRLGSDDIDSVETEHVRQTARLLAERCRSVTDAVESGRCAVVGCTYTLAEGRVRRVD
jgi:carbonic anhydrase